MSITEFAIGMPFIMKDGRFERIHVNENAVRSLNGRKSAYTTLHHRFAVSQCKWLFSILAGRYE